MVALLPASVTVASNAMVLVVGSLAWPLAVAGLLVEALDDDDAHPQSRTAVALAVVLSAATVGAPTMLLGTLSVWAYSVSVVCLPGVLVLGLRLASVCPSGPVSPRTPGCGQRRCPAYLRAACCSQVRGSG